MRPVSSAESPSQGGRWMSSWEILAVSRNQGLNPGQEVLHRVRFLDVERLLEVLGALGVMAVLELDVRELKAGHIGAAQDSGRLLEGEGGVGPVVLGRVGPAQGDEGPPVERIQAQERVQVLVHRGPRMAG